MAKEGNKITEPKVEESPAEKEARELKNNIKKILKAAQTREGILVGGKQTLQTGLKDADRNYNASDTTTDELRTKTLSDLLDGSKAQKELSFSKDSAKKVFNEIYISTSEDSTKRINNILHSELTELQKKSPEAAKEFFNEALKDIVTSTEDKKQSITPAKTEVEFFMKPDMKNLFRQDKEQQDKYKKLLKDKKNSLNNKEAAYEVAVKRAKHNIQNLQKLAVRIGIEEDVRDTIQEALTKVEKDTLIGKVKAIGAKISKSFSSEQGANQTGTRASMDSKKGRDSGPSI